MDYEKIREELRRIGVNSTLISKMSDIELKIANAIEDFDNFNYYMDGLVVKYGI